MIIHRWPSQTIMSKCSLLMNVLNNQLTCVSDSLSSLNHHDSLFNYQRPLLTMVKHPCLPLLTMVNCRWPPLLTMVHHPQRLIAPGRQTTCGWDSMPPWTGAEPRDAAALHAVVAARVVRLVHDWWWFYGWWFHNQWWFMTGLWLMMVHSLEWIMDDGWWLWLTDV